MSLRVGIIGAARRKQGTGPYVARTFANLGHTIVGIVGTSKQSIVSSIANLATEYNIQTQGYVKFDELAQQNDLDVLAICSPPDSHLYYLQQAINHNLHVFCEKPLWWPNNQSNNINRPLYEHEIQTIVEQAKQRQKIIHLNTQWTYTLKDFFNLYASKLDIPLNVTHFDMRLCPQSRGPSMVIDAASHGLSLLYQLLGQGQLANIQIEKSAPIDFEQLKIQFDYVHAEGTTEATFGLTNSQATPKPASYQINGYRVNRKIALPDYQFQLQSDTKTISIMDPLESSIRDFVASIEANIKSDEEPLILGAHHLYTLIDACR